MDLLLSMVALAQSDKAGNTRPSNNCGRDYLLNRWCYLGRTNCNPPRLVAPEQMLDVEDHINAIYAA